MSVYGVNSQYTGYYPNQNYSANRNYFQNSPSCGNDFSADNPYDIDAKASKISPEDALKGLKDIQGILISKSGGNDIKMSTLEDIENDPNTPIKYKLDIDRILRDPKLKNGLDSIDDPFALMTGRSDGHFDVRNIDGCLNHLNLVS